MEEIPKRRSHGTQAAILAAARDRFASDGYERATIRAIAAGSTSRPILCGFVAARVVTVTPLATGQPLTFTLQATVVAESTIVSSSR